MRKFILFPLVGLSIYANLMHDNTHKQTKDSPNTNRVHEYTMVIDKCVTEEVSIDDPKIEQFTRHWIFCRWMSWYNN